MELYILNQEFQVLTVIDAFESFIWTDRYNAYGDFELYLAVQSDILEYANQDFYLYYPQSERLMFIEQRTISTDTESGRHLTISGRSLESILDRRIVWTQTILTGNVQNAVQRLLNDNIINPANTDRKISNFIFEASTDPTVTSLKITSAQFTGTSLYEAIKSLCDNQNLGFKVVLNNSNQFVFSLYMGVDRSYSQDDNSYVIFSPDFDNITNSNYLESNKVLKNIALIAGEDEGLDRRTAAISTVGPGEASGLLRRELFVDARDISSNQGSGEELTDEEYISLLEQRGYEKMVDYVFVKSFEGDVDSERMFVYGEDFFLGDVVQIVNEFGIEATTRIAELIFSSNNEGNTIVPTFNIVS